MALDKYLAEEVCIDPRDGQITRRDALRLLGLMGLGVAVADSMLDAVPAAAATKTKAKARAKKRSTTSTTKPPATTKLVPTTNTAQPAPTAAPGPSLSAEAITFPGVVGTLRGSYSGATSPLGAVLIIHENRGLTDHFKALPGRFALAVDLASRVGGTDAVADQMPAPLSSARTEDLVADMRSALDELARRAPGRKLGIIGFCFGGGMVWSLLNAGEPRLAAAAPFYGTGPADADFSRSKSAAVLSVYAELDARVNANRPTMTAALERAGLVHEVRTFPGVDHAFFNDTGARYNATQATAAYAAVLAWFGRYLR